MILPVEILSRISIFMTNPSPLELALASKKLYEIISSCQTKALWVKNKYPNYPQCLRYILPSSPDGDIDVTRDTNEFNLMRLKLATIIKEPLFHYLVRLDNLPVNTWAWYAVEKGYERSFVFLIKKDNATDLSDQELVDLTMYSGIHGRLCILAFLSERLLCKNIPIPASLIFLTASKIVRQKNGKFFEPFIASNVVLSLEKLLPQDRSTRANFIGHCVQQSLHHGLVSLKIISRSNFSLWDLEDIDWSVANDQRSLDFFLRGLYVGRKLADSQGRVNQRLVDTIIEKDFIQCLRSLIVSGISLPLHQIVQHCLISNSLLCFKLLLESNQYASAINPRIDNDTYTRSAISINRPEMLKLLLPFWKSDPQTCLRMMYHSIQCDTPACLEVILTAVRSDQESLKLAISKIGRQRTSKGQTCLDLLLKSNPEVVEAMEISKTAVESLGDFIVKSKSEIK